VGGCELIFSAENRGEGNAILVKGQRERYRVLICILRGKPSCNTIMLLVKRRSRLHKKTNKMHIGMHQTVERKNPTPWRETQKLRCLNSSDIEQIKILHLLPFSAALRSSLICFYNSCTPLCHQRDFDLPQGIYLYICC